MTPQVKADKLRYMESIKSVYEKAARIYPELATTEIIVTDELQGVVVSKGTDEDEGKYKISITFESEEQVVDEFTFGLSCVLYNMHNPEDSSDNVIMSKVSGYYHNISNA